MTSDAPPLRPRQAEIVALLGKGGERPEVSAATAGELRDALEEALAPLRPGVGEPSEPVPERPLWVSKHQLAAIHGCETHAVAERSETFRWTPAAARGVVAHKAIELLINWRGEPSPGVLVDEALARLADSERSIGEYVGALADAEHAELRSFAVDKVTKFTDCFPPLPAKWIPVTESAVRVELWDGQLVLAGKTDLTLGRPGDKVIIDLKSGSTLGSHREDLRFYALLETLRMDQPPRKVATYYLDTARAHAEDVSEAMLWAALRRTVDGITRMVELQRAIRTPDVRPGSACRWCPLNDTCEPGRSHLERLDDPDSVGVW
jgi:RecB family exonuclease